MATPIDEAVLPADGKRNDPADFVGDKSYLEKIEPEPTALDRLKNLSVTNRIAEMEANLQNEKYIFPELALSGQITLFYAWPNTGKTIFFIKFIRDAIQDGTVKGEDVFYINADDSYKGLYTKANLACEIGLSMISPSEAGVSPQDILKILATISDDDDASGKVILLDTLKKFADMMNKRSQADLYETLRRFITKGGTVIIAGHANKHKNAEGELVYEGTSDTMNDVDCVYSMYRMTEPKEESQVVEFRREKDRGDVIARVSYQYQKTSGIRYIDMLDSVTRIDDEQAQKVIANRQQSELKERYEAERLFVLDILKSEGPLNQSAIVKALEKNDDLNREITKRRLQTALDRLTDICWTAKRGKNNAKVFNLIGADARDYRSASRGD